MPVAVTCEAPTRHRTCPHVPEVYWFALDRCYGTACRACVQRMAFTWSDIASIREIDPISGRAR